MYSTKKRPPLLAETPLKGDKVERAGYVPTNRRIAQFIEAGNRLALSRKEQFDCVDGSEPAIDPLRKPGVDMAEVSTMHRRLKGRLAAATADAKKAKEVTPPQSTAPQGKNEGGEE